MATYATLVEVKRALKIPSGNTAYDSLIDSKIAAASAAIEDRCGKRRFDRGTEPKVRTIEVTGRVVREGRDELLLVPDIAAADGFQVQTDTGAYVTGVRLRPSDALDRGWPVTALRLPLGGWSYLEEVQITAVWGWPEVPKPIAEACFLQTLRLFRRKDSPEGVAGSAEWGLARIPHLDPDVRVLVEPYRLPGIA